MLAGCAAVHTHVLPGDPATCIARLAGDLDADLILMGTRGRGARAHAGLVFRNTIVAGSLQGGGCDGAVPMTFVCSVSSGATKLACGSCGSVMMSALESERSV